VYLKNGDLENKSSAEVIEMKNGTVFLECLRKAMKNLCIVHVPAKFQTGPPAHK
jgi:hypothetical protein